MDELRANEGREELITVDGITYSRLPVKTCLVTAEHNLSDVLEEYVKPYTKEGDIVFVSEKMVACSQGRSIPVDTIKASGLAKFLSKFVEPVYSLGLGQPETMQCAIDEVGAPRILVAAAAGAMGKLLRKRGWFYKVAGTKVAQIDGPAVRTIPPYDTQVVLTALEPVKCSKEAKERIGVDVAIVDANRVACRLCGASSESITEEWLNKVLSDNPLGQGTQQTPCGIIRKVN
jgi:F420-0:gamma-glutamyl ligase-like protein